MTISNSSFLFITSWSALHAGLRKGRPHNEVTAAVDDDSLAWPLEEDDHFATTRYQILHVIHVMHMSRLWSYEKGRDCTWTFCKDTPPGMLAIV